MAKLSETPGLAEAVARRRKIRMLCNEPGMDDIAVKLNAQPTYDELKATKRFLDDVDAILERLA